MAYTIRHTFPTTIENFWSKIFFDADYNRRLYVDVLQFKAYDIVEFKEEDSGKKTRKMRTEPKAEAPAVVKKLIGDSLSYLEEGTFDPVTKHWKYRIITSKMSDKILVSGDFWVEARGDQSVERICTIDCQVKIFGVGGVIEGFIEKTTRDSFEKAADFTRTYIAEKGL